MLFNLRSIVLFSASTATSPFCCGPVAAVPPGVAPAEPVVVDPVVADDPEELAVPALLVPGGGGEATLAAFPAPLGSLPELFRPPTLAGPDGTPLTAAVPAPAEPAPGEPVAVPADGPLAAPQALCANEPAGDIRIASAAIAAAVNILVIAKLPFGVQRRRLQLVPGLPASVLGTAPQRPQCWLARSAIRYCIHHPTCSLIC